MPELYQVQYRKKGHVDAIRGELVVMNGVVTWASPWFHWCEGKTLETVRAWVISKRGAVTVAEYPCQVCGGRYPASELWDVKGNFPGGCKTTCGACIARLERVASVEEGR